MKIFNLRFTFLDFMSKEKKYEVRPFTMVLKWGVESKVQHVG